MKSKMKTINASEFKAKCLRILEQIEPQGILITKRGRPIARVIPAGIVDNSSLIGSMKNSICIKGDIFSTGVRWDVESGHAHSYRPVKRRAK
jgi:prevent-host-death family protein